MLCRYSICNFTLRKRRLGKSFAEVLSKCIWMYALILYLFFWWFAGSCLIWIYQEHYHQSSAAYLLWKYCEAYFPNYCFHRSWMHDSFRISMRSQNNFLPFIYLFFIFCWRDFMWNNITGSIPKEIGNITTLELLWVEILLFYSLLIKNLFFLFSCTILICGEVDNFLIHLITFFIFQFTFDMMAQKKKRTRNLFLVSIASRLLNGNHLTGPLPDELGYLPHLDRIQIDQNHISGPIPASFANLNKTKHLWVYFIKCTLRIGAGFCHNSFLYLLVLFTFLSSHMNNNSLSGQIPPELSRLPSLVHL